MSDGNIFSPSSQTRTLIYFSVSPEAVPHHVCSLITGVVGKVREISCLLWISADTETAPGGFELPPPDLKRKHLLFLNTLCTGTAEETQRKTL